MDPEGEGVEGAGRGEGAGGLQVGGGARQDQPARLQHVHARPPGQGTGGVVFVTSAVAIQYLVSPRLRGLRVVDGHPRPVSRGGDPVHTGVVNLQISG